MSKKRIVLNNVNRLIDVDIDGIIVSIKPPNLDEKDLYIATIGMGRVLDSLKAGRYLIQMCLKGIKADIHIENEDGETEPFKLDFNDRGWVTEECMEMLGQFPIFEKLRATTLNFSQGTPIDKLYQVPPNNDNPDGILLEGVSIVKKKKKVKKK